jgi:hypothetical protein
VRQEKASHKDAEVIAKHAEEKRKITFFWEQLWKKQ